MIKYHAFAKAVEMRNISKAAEILGYSRSKLSNIIGSLEDELGLRLLKEEDGLVVLTESGKKLIPYCQQIVETERKLKFEALSMLNQSEDSIRIGTPNSMLVGFVSDLIARFTQDHKNRHTRSFIPGRSSLGIHTRSFSRKSPLQQGLF